MSIDAAEIARLREQLLDDKVPGLPACWNTLMRALLDELEKARDERDTWIKSSCAMESLVREIDDRIAVVTAERDSARALLRETDLQLGYLDSGFPTGTTPTIRARIAAALGDKP